LGGKAFWNAAHWLPGGVFPLKNAYLAQRIRFEMEIPSLDILKSLDGRAASMLALLKRQDVEGLATSSAKRRFFRVELEVAGIEPDRIPTELIDKCVDSGCESLAIWLGSLRKLGEYAKSEARRKWNPDATANDKASQVPVASDWFLQSTYPKDWDEFDFLSRCESIWRGNNFTGGGMLFTRIFNYRVKMQAGYEDGLRLVLLLSEVGDYVPPLDLSTPSEPVRVEAVDLVRRMNAYDGREPDDYYQLIQVPMGKKEWAFSLAELNSRPFSKLKDILGQENFDKIMQAQGYRYPEGPFQTYVGEQDLELSYYTRPSDQPGATELVIVSNGEYQPGRIKAHVEGFWRVYGAKF
jgi:hypothetical protein